MKFISINYNAVRTGHLPTFKTPFENKKGRARQARKRVNIAPARVRTTRVFNRYPVGSTWIAFHELSDLVYSNGNKLRLFFELKPLATVGQL
jgi:hypothetical protein